MLKESLKSEIIKYHNNITGLSYYICKKKSMKKVIIVLGISMLAFNVNAQKNSDSKINFNVGGEVAFATGNLSSVYSIGLGATANLEYKVDEKITAYLNAGLIEYVGKKVPGTQLKLRSSAAIPLLAGGKYFVAKNFYGNLALGMTIFSGVGGASRFTYIPGFGFKANEKIDVLLKYTGYANSGGAFGVRVSYAL